MQIAFLRKYKPMLINFLIVIAMVVALDTGMSGGIIRAVFNMDEEVKLQVLNMFENRNQAIINGDLDLIKSMYDTNTKYGTWAYEYEYRKVKYLHNWEKKQGAKFTEINPTVAFKSIKDKGDNISIYLICSTEYKYVYETNPDVVNSFRIGTYHVLDLVEQGEAWIIAKEWYKDPFGDSLNLERIDSNSIREYILAQTRKDMSDLPDRRLAAVDYADKYCGAATEEEYGFKYNKAYRNYNSQGGDCANFASQILFEGGKFRKNSRWGYDRNGATRSWVNADGFKSYWLNSGRASLIAYGNYEKVYKAAYKLLPGDFVAYEKKGDITHISVVTGIDSKGYPLVSCHNTDRNKVPWDLGWSNSSIRFYLVRVHF